MLRGLFATTTFAAMAAVAGCTSVLGISDDPKTQPATTNNTPTPDAGGDAGPTGPLNCSGTVFLNLQADFDSAIKDWSIPTFKGFYDYLREQNEKGGLPGGCKYDMVVKNNSYTPAKAESIYRQWQTEPRFKDVLMVLNAGTPDTNQVAPFALADAKLHFTGSSAARFTSPVGLDGKTVDIPRLNDTFTEFSEPTTVGKVPGYPYLFFAGADYSTTARLGSKLAAELGAKRPGYVACTTSIYCTDPIPAGRVSAAAVGLLPGRSLTIELAAKQDDIIQKTLDFLKAEKDKKTADPTYVPVDWLWMGNTSKTTAYFINAVAIAMKELKWVPDMSAQPLPIMINSAGFDEELPLLAQAACANEVTDLAPPAPSRKTICSTAFKDLKVYGAVAYTPYGEPAAFMDAVQALHDKWLARDKATPDPNLAELPAADLRERKNLRYVQGYATGVLFDGALRKTLQSGRPLTTDNVRATLESTSNDSLGGLVALPTGYKPTDHRPAPGALVYTVDATGKLVRPPISKNPVEAIDDKELAW